MVELQMVCEVPERTVAQRVAALRNANRIRSVRAQFKVDVKHGRESVTALLLMDECPRDFATMHVVDLILAMPKVGRQKVNQMLVQSRISPSKTVGGMTLRQRTELVSMLRRYEGGRS
jgi:hypothetical protein